MSPKKRAAIWGDDILLKQELEAHRQDRVDYLKSRRASARAAALLLKQATDIGNHASTLLVVPYSIKASKAKFDAPSSDPG